MFNAFNELLMTFPKISFPYHHPHNPFIPYVESDNEYDSESWIILNLLLGAWPYHNCDREERKELQQFNCCHICYKRDNREMKHTLCCYLTTHAHCMNSFLADQMKGFNYRVDSCCPFCRDWYIGFAEDWERHWLFSLTIP